MQCCNICVDNANKSRFMVYIVLCMYTLHIMIRLRCQRQFLTSFSSKTIKFLNCRVPLEAILLTGNLITGLNTTGIFSTDKVIDNDLILVIFCSKTFSFSCYQVFQFIDSNFSPQVGLNRLCQCRTSGQFKCSTVGE